MRLAAFINTIMELNEYQKRAMTTCTESSRNVLYMLLNLQGEVGEFSGKIAKLIRKGKAWFNVGEEPTSDVGKTIHHNEDHLALGNMEELSSLVSEAGDILWQLSGLCSVMGWSLEDVAQENLNKLSDRQQRNVIVGEGDNR